jgi:hypothetical protein
VEAIQRCLTKLYGKINIFFHFKTRSGIYIKIIGLKQNDYVLKTTIADKKMVNILAS